MSKPMAEVAILVNRYAGSRLYDTAHGCYVTVEQLRAWRAEGTAFAVVDVDTGQKITRLLVR